MNLTLAAASLARSGLGLADIRQFAILCRDGAREANSESAALILLAEKAISFFDRHEGIAMTNDALHEFVNGLANEVAILREAAGKGDATLVEALNTFASVLSGDVMI